MNQSFSFSVPTVVRFGHGVSDSVPDALPAGVKRVAVLRGASGIAAATVVKALKQAGLSVDDIACGGEPSVASVNAIVANLAGQPIDAIVACGGGAVLDSGKAVAFCLGHNLQLTEDFADVPQQLLEVAGPIPCIAVPTTAGTGAEVTANAVLEIPSQQAKVSLRGRALFPVAALVDPRLLPSAPTNTVLSSGLDAIVQTIESYTSCAATPFSDVLTRPNIALGLSALSDVLGGGGDAAWGRMAWVSLTSGLALANSGLGAAHGIASVLGGRYGAPHGALCGRLLVPVLRQNISMAEQGSDIHARLSECASAIADAFAPAPGGDAMSGLEAWQDAQGLPRLAAFGVAAVDIEVLAVQSASASSSRKNGVPLMPSDYEAILAAAL